MSQQLFEVAFSGQISEGADAAEVRARVGKLFNADDAKLKQLFSGKRIVIKKNIDQATAAKYKTALERSGAVCEVKPMGPDAPAAETRAEPLARVSEAAASSGPAEDTPASAAGESEAGLPPQTDPLGITGDQIEDLAVSLAPAGSAMQDEYESVDEPQFDLQGLDIAPVGSDLGTASKKADPPPPDISGLALEE